MCPRAPGLFEIDLATARRLATQWGDKGPLLPVHIHTAYGLLDDQGRTLRPRTKRRRL